ncbi:MAG: hypothetical protein ABI551_22215 [Polyangiaceae bacterium]
MRALSTSSTATRDAHGWTGAGVPFGVSVAVDAGVGAGALAAHEDEEDGAGSEVLLVDTGAIAARAQLICQTASPTITPVSFMAVRGREAAKVPVEGH